MWQILDARIRQAPARLQAKVDRQSRQKDEQKDKQVITIDARVCQRDVDVKINQPA
jgi:hypothetical protein